MAAPPLPEFSPMQVRVLDVAWDLFSRQGVRATTMSRIADDTGISRVWLYRQFPNRDSILAALVLREATTFVKGLTGALEGIANPRELLVTAFTWGVEWCRDHELLNALLEKESDLLLPQLTIDVGPALSQGARLLSGRLRRLEVDPERADELADWVVRAIWSHTLTPKVLVDLSDPAALRRYAGTVLVPESVDVRG